MAADRTHSSEFAAQRKFGQPRQECRVPLRQEKFTERGELAFDVLLRREEDKLRMKHKYFPTPQNIPRVPPPPQETIHLRRLQNIWIFGPHPLYLHFMQLISAVSLLCFNPHVSL